MLKQIILLWKPEDKSTLIEDNLEVLQKIWKAAINFFQTISKSVAWWCRGSAFLVVWLPFSWCQICVPPPVFKLPASHASLSFSFARHSFGHSGSVHDTVRPTFPFYGAWTRTIPAVTGRCLVRLLSVFTEDFQVVPCHCLCHIWHVTVAEFHSVSCEQFV